jgi:hypothetical protein
MYNEPELLVLVVIDLNRAAFDIHTAGESVDSGYGIDTVEFRKYFELMIPQ